MRAAVLVAAALACAGGAAAQRITSLPGLDPLPPWAMYSGYVNFTSPLQGSTKHHFYWFHESQRSPSTDPIVLWMQVRCKRRAGVRGRHTPRAAAAAAASTSSL